MDHHIKANENKWYHHYTITNKEDQEDFWEDMQIILIELPKWKKLSKFDLNKPKDRWLMYFTEPTLFDRLSKEEYARYTEISEAMESLETKNFTPEQIRGYELYLDSIRQYHTTMTIEREEGRMEGKEIGLNTSLQIIEEIKKNKLTPEEIATSFNIKLDLVLKLKELF